MSDRERGLRERGFQWPPKSPAAEPPAPPPAPLTTPPSEPSPLAVPDAPRGAWWRSIERAWLGVTESPLAVRLHESGWTPGLACPRCGGNVGPSEASEAEGCPACRDRRLRWSRFVRVGAYEGELARAVRSVKYEAWARLGRDLGRLLGERLAADLTREGIEPREAVLVPAPMDWRRRMGRGIDHAAAIAGGVSAATGSAMEGWLARAWRPTQASTPRSRRRTNVRGSMRAARGAERRVARALARGVRLVVVVDDIRTTGATLTESCRTLQRLLAQADADGARAVRIWAAAVAVTPGTGRRTDVPGASGAASGNATGAAASLRSR